MSDDRFVEELRRLKGSQPPSGDPGGIGIDHFIAKCPGNASLVLARAKEVLSVISESASDPSFSSIDWHSRLPHWFINQCGPELTREQADAMIAEQALLPIEEFARRGREAIWSLGNWIYCIEPEYRSWTWWDGQLLDESNLVISVEVTEWPFGWGALQWLFRASGAKSLDAME